MSVFFLNGSSSGCPDLRCPYCNQGLDIEHQEELIDACEEELFFLKSLLPKTSKKPKTKVKKTNKAKKAKV